MQRKRSIQFIVSFNVLLFFVLFGAAASQTGSTEPTLRSWSFDRDSPQALPKDFTVGTLFDGRVAGEWHILEVPQAPTPPNVLAQLSSKGAEHAYKIVLVEGTGSADLEPRSLLSRCGWERDMGGGVI